MDNLTLNRGWSDSDIAGWLRDRIGDLLARRAGPVTITVPGGSTPFPIFEAMLASNSDCDWSRLVVWPGDDRIVPEDHAASNTGKIRALFEPKGAEVVTLTVMEQVPHFDIAWLGMGADGHIASLFPNTDPQIDEPVAIRRLTPDPLPPEAPFDRITLTMPSLLASDILLFVIRGDDKRALFEAASRGDNDLPIARLLGAADQPLICFA